MEIGYRKQPNVNELFILLCYLCASSALMDCVGCEKCRLWGKLQILGVGTALKILFSVDSDNSVGQPVRLALTASRICAACDFLHLHHVYHVFYGSCYLY